MTKIALFGTSSDPPTEAHKTILQWLSEHYDLVAVWASNNPFKSQQTPLEHREKMLQLLINEIDPDRRNNIHLREDLSSPRSLETVQKARKVWGDEVEFHLVVGSDLVGQIPQWHASQDLLTAVKLLIIPRPGYLIRNEDLERLRKLGGEWAIADFQAPALSSTGYRERKEQEAVPPSVEDYIHQEQLYSSCRNVASTQ